MTKLLETAFAAAARLPEAEQDALAARLLSDLRADDAWDAKFSATQDRLGALAAQALAEHRVGRTKPLSDGDIDLAHD